MGLQPVMGWTGLRKIGLLGSLLGTDIRFIHFDLFFYDFKLPRSNRHGRKRPFTEKNGDIRRSYTNTVHGHRIRCETVRNGFRIRRSWKNTEWLKTELLCSVYGAIRLPYTVVYHRVRLYTVIYGYSMYYFSDSHWNWVNI